MKVISRKNALADGLKTYFTGKPCKYGHVDYRTVANFCCVTCGLRKARIWREENPDKHRSAVRRWSGNNPEKKKEYAAKYVRSDATKEKAAARDRLKKAADPIGFRAEVARRARNRRSADPEKYAAKDRQWNRNNIEKRRASSRKWAAKNKGTKAALENKRRAAKIKRTPAWADLQAIKEIYVVASKLKLHVDHIIPLQGRLVCGLHVENNLQMITAEENARKHNKFTDSEARLIGAGLVLTDVMQKDSTRRKMRDAMRYVFKEGTINANAAA